MARQLSFPRALRRADGGQGQKAHPEIAAGSFFSGGNGFGSMIFVELQLTGTEDPAVPEAAARPDTPPVARRQQNPQVDELLTAIIARPLFSSTRRPPQGTAANEADSDLADTRLTGIVTEPGRRMAIFAVNGEKPLRVAEGDAVSGWRIESITPREVSLSGPGGTKIMQPKMDPNFVSPPGQPPTAGPGGRLPIPPPVAGRERPPVPPVAAGAGPPGSAVPINNPGLLRRPAQPPEGFPAAPRPSAR